MQPRSRSAAVLSLIAVLPVASSLLAGGCGSLVASEQMRETLHGESTIAAPVPAVWDALRKETIDQPGYVTLTDSLADHVLSWREDGSTWQARLASADRTKHAETLRHLIADVGGNGFAITTAWLQDRGGACYLRLRRVYYGSGTRPYFAQSRGHCEHSLIQAIRLRLGLPESTSE